MENVFFNSFLRSKAAGRRIRAFEMNGDSMSIDNQNSIESGDHLYCVLSSFDEIITEELTPKSCFVLMIPGSIIVRSIQSFNAQERSLVVACNNPDKVLNPDHCVVISEETQIYKILTISRELGKSD